MIIGHKKQWEFLKKSFLNKKLSHGYLFSGPGEVGKKTIAFEFVKFINCQENQIEKRPCNSCSSCSALLKGIHSDFVLVEPELSKKEIQISQIRGLIYKLSLKPFLSSYKTAIIDRADLMNSQAQNCLLKTLEEPKGNTLLILIAEHPGILFETIRSRVQEVKFHLVPRNEIENLLHEKGASEELIKEIVSLSLRRPGKALEFFKDFQKLEREKKQVLELSKLLNGDLATRFQYAHSLSKKPLKEVFETWLRYFREFLLFKIGAQKDITSLPDFLTNLSLSQIKKIIEQLERMNYLISTKNINKRLALEMLMMNIYGLSRNY